MPAFFMSGWNPPPEPPGGSWEGFPNKPPSLRLKSFHNSSRSGGPALAAPLRPGIGSLLLTTGRFDSPSGALPSALPGSAGLSSSRPQRESFKLNIRLTHRGKATERKVKARMGGFMSSFLIYLAPIVHNHTSSPEVPREWDVCTASGITSRAIVARRWRKAGRPVPAWALTKIRGTRTPSISNSSSSLIGW